RGRAATVEGGEGAAAPAARTERAHRGQESVTPPVRSGAIRCSSRRETARWVLVRRVHCTRSVMSPTTIFSPATTPARWIFDLSNMVYAVCGAIFVIVGSLLVYAVVKFRRRKGQDASEPAQVYGSKQIELAWTIIPILIVVVLFLSTARVIAFTQKPSFEETAVNVDVVGHQF